MIEFRIAMEVILNEDIEKLGKAGDLVTVKPGYARNYLLPRGYALYADASTLRVFERRKAKLEEQAQKKREEAQARKESLERENNITIKVKAGATGKLFGAITKEIIADALKEQLNIEVDRHKIKIDSPIKAIGESIIKISLGSGIESEILVKVEPLS